MQCQELSKSFGSKSLFKDLSFSIFSGDRIGLIGSNGTGKSTLLNILAGLDKADAGTISSSRDLKIGYVTQTCDFPHLTPAEILLNILGAHATSLSDYEQEALVQAWLNKLGFRDKHMCAAHLSGGWKKRLAIAQQLITSPDLLLLDEPTNHLDLEGIIWLEKFLAREAISYLLVSHDRYFLQNATSKIIEIDPTYPQGSLSVDGSYDLFLKRKEEFLEAQLERQRSLASKARREIEWLRQSPKARTSKSKARVDDAHELLDELSQVQQRNKKRLAGIDFTASERETRKLLVAKNLSKNLGERTLFQRLDFTLAPGVRMGLMGPNGSGKTTLLRLLANELLPDQGTMKRADALKVVYFDQHRTQLPDTMTLKDALSPRGDHVIYLGQPIHVNGWCKRFLFSPDMLDRPLAQLSGGERARIAIAHLMLQPADLLLLDEPTNDLDIPTLETLEESLLEFPGAVVLITHDRCMLHRVCNVFLALGDPERTDVYADYHQWEDAVKAQSKTESPKIKATKSLTSRPKLSYAEKKEYEQMEGKIAQLEEDIRHLVRLLEEAAATSNAPQLQELSLKVSLEEAKLEQLYIRWMELEHLKTPPDAS